MHPYLSHSSDAHKQHPNCEVKLAARPGWMSSFDIRGVMLSREVVRGMKGSGGKEEYLVCEVRFGWDATELWKTMSLPSPKTPGPS